jgi:hypothetical protein
MKYSIPSQIVKAILILAALLLLLASTASAGGSIAIYPYVIGGGGGHSQADPYVLDGTVGQAVAGTVSNTPYDLCAGFWCGMGQYKVYLPLVLRNYP